MTVVGAAVIRIQVSVLQRYLLEQYEHMNVRTHNMM